MQPAPDLCVLVWNSEWARPDSQRGRMIREVLRSPDPDLICLTEGYEEILPETGHIITSEPDYGYKLFRGRRKVLLWSREPWRSVDVVGSKDLPTGRFVGGVTCTSLGDIGIVGVCIPWKDAHVRTGKRNRAAWEDHCSYLRTLPLVLDECDTRERFLLAGDWNQRIPPTARVPAMARELLTHALDRLTITTAGPVNPHGNQVIDHLTCSPDLIAVSRETLPCEDGTGRPLSDHVGVVVRLRSDV